LISHYKTINETKQKFDCPTNPAIKGAYVLDRSNNGIVGSNSASGMYVCMYVFMYVLLCVMLSCVGRGFLMSRSTVQEVIPKCLKES